MLRIIFILLLVALQVEGSGQTIQAAGVASSSAEHSKINKSERLLQLAEKSTSLDSVHYYLAQAEIISRRNKDGNQLAHHYLVAGGIFRNRSLYDHALENYFEALKQYEALGDSLQSAGVLNNIGNIYMITKDLDEALRYFQRCEKIYASLGHIPGILSTAVDIGATFQKMGNYGQALQEYSYALKNADYPGFEREKGILLGNIGSTYMQQGRPDSALVFLQKALMIKEAVATRESIAHTLNDLSETALKLGHIDEALAYADSAANLSKTANSANQLRYAYLNKSNGFEKLNQFEKAYRNRLKFEHINDSLFGIEKERLFDELRVKYETEKKDQAIVNLKRENEIADLRKEIYLAAAIIILLVAAVLIYWQIMRVKRQRELLKKEKEIDRMKTNFFANISHEFRTPLTLILSPLETILERESNNKQKEQLHIMKRNANRLLQLINQILDLSKLEAGELKLQKQKVDIVDLLKEVIHSFDPLMETKRINCSFESNVRELSAIADAEKIETIVFNLISNALKFTESEGKVSVVLDYQDSRLKLEVADTGIGIPKERLQFVFNRYYQVDSVDFSTEFTGSGIGLALTKQLVDLLGGSIGVESEPGKGTRFLVYLPVEVTSSQVQRHPFTEVNQHTPAENSPVREEQSLEEDGSEPSEKPLVLLIEDNTDVRKYLSDILLRQYEIMEAENGEQGLETARAAIPDLIVSDVMMPKMDGYTLTKCLKNDERTSHIPIILLTAKTSVDSRITGLETEADLYLGKPFVPKELMVCIKNLIESRKRLRERYRRDVYLKPAEVAVNSIDEQFLIRVMRVLEANYNNSEFTVERLGKEVGMSRSQIHRKLHALTNESSSRFIRSFRLQKAMNLLKKNAGTISEISYEVGFNSPSYFNKCFLEQYGHTPSDAIDRVR